MGDAWQPASFCIRSSGIVVVDCAPCCPGADSSVSHGAFLQACVCGITLLCFQKGPSDPCGFTWCRCPTMWYWWPTRAVSLSHPGFTVRPCGFTARPCCCIARPVLLHWSAPSMHTAFKLQGCSYVCDKDFETQRANQELLVLGLCAQQKHQQKQLP